MISVVVPTFNAARFLPDCVHSILSQTLRPDEVIFVDDQSTDNTVHVLKNFQRDVPISIKVICISPNAGPSRARNVGMSAATGDWIAFFDADDLWHPDHLESLLCEARISGASVVYSGVEVQDMVSKRSLFMSGYSNPREIPRSLYRSSFIMPSQVLMRRDLFERGTTFDESLRYGEDADFWVCLYHAGASFTTTNKATFVYRKHADTPSQNAEGIAAANAYRMKKYQGFNDYPSVRLRLWALQDRMAAARLAWRSSLKRALHHVWRGVVNG